MAEWALDGERAFVTGLVAEAQPLIVFQPLLPPDWKMTLREGSIACAGGFFRRTGQGLKCGHGVLRYGSADAG